ncbi:Rho1 guanine nucleotide exchange factor 1 [Neolecta irregularis DAH-3]|uniref:Rho1 guanine nucleotide exchange factor 1 n=1 Tax=Neolecta irregularis (strain DAH-3) TaxID=1198029 RepID=A0A1U7LQB1_NEOID|nr:Rho1 guanine nucleotide exchange factor 1 [Neolecta irregularis DAH-3]|eukprot:OLL24819.1 Rho1 guanine nucleotide exchange factor 1 [Neolecta irregularis DAH-3]
MQLEERLSFKQGENVDLKLSDPNRQMLHKGMLKKRESSSDTRGDTVQVFLFDHALLIVKVKVVSKREQYKVTRRPIPLELLVVSTAEEPRGSLTKRPSSSLLPGTSKNGKLETTKADTGKSGGYSLVFTHLGRRGYTITLYAGTYVNRRKWIENISSQQRLLIEGSRVFVSVVTCEKYFMGGNRVNYGGRKLAYGTDTGIYVSDRKPHSTTKSTPVRTLTLSNVAQMDILEEYGLILVLSDKSLFSFPLEALDPNDQTLANKRPRKIAGHLNFFKVGVCLGRFLVCVVKSSVLSSTIKVFEPVDHVSKGKKQPAFRKLLQGGTEMLKVFKEFYIPTESSSIHFLKTKLCVGCAKGFEVVSLENLETQSLLDPADTSLDFVQRRETVRPIAIYRMNGEFLVCYDEFAFFVNKNGWRARSDWIIHWEGMPSSFALNYPYILAFEPSFIEIHHLESGALSQVIPGNNITLLSDGRGKLGEGGEILYGCENSEGENQVHALMRHI